MIEKLHFSYSVRVTKVTFLHRQDKNIFKDQKIIYLKVI